MLLQAILSGLAIGSIYALIAQGYYVTHVTTNTLNMGQGDFLMLGALLGVTLYTSGVPLVGVIALVLIFMAVVGIGLEQIAIRPLKTAMSIGWIMSTVAVSLMIRNGAALIWGRNIRQFPAPFGQKIIRFLGAGIQPQEIFVFVVAIAAMLLLVLFLKKSMLGKALMAVAFSPDAAALMGINVRRMYWLSYAISTALAGLGGVLVAPITNTGAYMGGMLGLKAFAAAILGGLGEPFGILLGGLVLGVTEMLVANINSALKDSSAFILILAILAIRPTGLLSKVISQKV